MIEYAINRNPSDGNPKKVGLRSGYVLKEILSISGSNDNIKI
jgi:hypothetical protein